MNPSYNCLRSKPLHIPYYHYIISLVLSMRGDDTSPPYTYFLLCHVTSYTYVYGDCEYNYYTAHNISFSGRLVA